jgi:endonuclease III
MLPFDDLLQRLRDFYGPLTPPPHDVFGCYVWEVMNFHAAPAKRDAAIAGLRRIPALTPDAIWKAPLGKLEAATVLAGPYLDERVRALRTGADVFRRQPQLTTAVSRSTLSGRRALRALPQLGDAAAYRVLLYAGGHAVMPIDPNTTRVITRLGYVPPSPHGREQVRRVRRALSRLISRQIETIGRSILLLEHHGQATCLEYDPHCHICPLRGGCPTGQRREG